LIGTLTRCGQQIGAVKAAHVNKMAAWDQVHPAKLEGWRVIRDRLFVAHVLKREAVSEDWKEIERMSELLPVGEHAGLEQTFNVTDYQPKLTELHEKLVRLASKDLRIKA